MLKDILKRGADLLPEALEGQLRGYWKRRCLEFVDQQYQLIVTLKAIQ